MSSPTPLHPNESRLMAYVDNELTGVESAVVEAHIEACSECRSAVAAMREALDQLAAYQQQAKSDLPEPPEPWFDLLARLHELDAGRVPIRRSLPFRVSLRWAAVAAGVVLFAFLYTIGGERKLNAAELLAKASDRYVRPVATQRIQIKTRRAKFARPAQVQPVRSSEEMEELRALFETAQFNWEEPLSARAFAQWRNSLQRKDDRVRILNNQESGEGRFYEITTSTETGVLTQASITIRAADLKAVRETLDFRSFGLVEISEANDPGSVAAPPLQTTDTDDEIPAPPEPVSASDELRVLAALHAIGADLGEPIEIGRNEEGTQLLVTMLGGTESRRQQVRAAIGDLPKVRLRFEEPQPVRESVDSRVTSDVEAGVGPLGNLLRDRVSADVDVAEHIDRILMASEAALARAHALRALADRFPASAANTLTNEEWLLLASIQRDHLKHLQGSVRQLEELLRSLPLPGGVASAASTGDWRQQAESLLNAAQQLDQTINTAFAGIRPTRSPGEILAEIARELAAMRARSSQYETNLASGRIRD